MDEGFDLKRLLNTEISLFKRGFSDQNKESFYLELSMLISSGLNIKSALELIKEEQSSPAHTALIHRLEVDLINGVALWEAMRDTGEFTPYEFFSIQIGEETGKLTKVLDQLHQFFSAKLKQRQQLISALSYPLIILFTSIGAVAFMMLFIVPMFSDVFKRFGGDLPDITKAIIAMSFFVRNYFLLIVSIFSVVGIMVYKSRKKEWLRKYSSKLLFRIPVLGNIIFSLQLARFCNSMALLLGSKVPLVRSLELIGQMINFYPIQVTLAPMTKEIYRGSSLQASMAHHSVFGKKMISLVKVGEEVNKLDVFFDKLAQQFSSTAQHQTGLINTFLEPAMIIFLGIVVGFILLAMYLPMFQLSTSIGG
jgi:type IV pilus assembly protein PilC